MASKTKQSEWITVTHSKSLGKEMRGKKRENAKNSTVQIPKNFWEHIVASFGKVCIEDEYEDEYHERIVLREETKQIVFTMDGRPKVTLCQEGKFTPSDTGRHNRIYQVNHRVVVLIFEPEDSNHIDVGFEAMINIDGKTHLYDRALAFGPIRRFKDVIELKNLTDCIYNGLSSEGADPLSGGSIPQWFHKK